MVGVDVMTVRGRGVTCGGDNITWGIEQKNAWRVDVQPTLRRRGGQGKVTHVNPRISFHWYPSLVQWIDIVQMMTASLPTHIIPPMTAHRKRHGEGGGAEVICRLHAAAVYGHPTGTPIHNIAPVRRRVGVLVVHTVENCRLERKCVRERECVYAFERESVLWEWGMKIVA